ncbi:Xylose isomerase domain protein TIM barrel [Planctomycetales bacterium 10988]|nr:Xylose isomerase domain protein TIM barrel [Planctomycetales bacterium 10988]
MTAAPDVILSGFADEAANNKTIIEQFAAMAAIGLQYFSIRFIDVGNGIKNVMDLTEDEIKIIKEKQAEYGLKVATIGSPIGKVKLLDQEDGTSNKYIPFEEYLEKDVKTACDRANALETKLIRGFSFYHPKDTPAENYLAQTVDQLGKIAEVCDAAGLTFGLEVEANLVGQTGKILAEIHRQVNHPALVTVFDAANLHCQGFTPIEVFEEYEAMKPGLGWIHIKDYQHPRHVGRTRHVDEEAIWNFVPADMGTSGHEWILRDFHDFLPTLAARVTARDIPGVFVDLEPHVKGGGQFGGFSGPDGMGVALRGLCNVLDFVGIGYHLRDFEDIRAARGR